MHAIAEVKRQVRELVDANRTLTAKVREGAADRARLERALGVVERDREWLTAELDRATAALRDIRVHLETTVHDVEASGRV